MAPQAAHFRTALGGLSDPENPPNAKQAVRQYGALLASSSSTACSVQHAQVVQRGVLAARPAPTYTPPALIQLKAQCRPRRCTRSPAPKYINPGKSAAVARSEPPTAFIPLD